MKNFHTYYFVQYFPEDKAGITCGNKMYIHQVICNQPGEIISVSLISKKGSIFTIRLPKAKKMMVEVAWERRCQKISLP